MVPCFDHLDYGGPRLPVFPHVFEEEQIIHLKHPTIRITTKGGDDWDSQWGPERRKPTRPGDGSAAPDWVMVKVPIEATTSVEGENFGGGSKPLSAKDLALF